MSSEPRNWYPHSEALTCVRAVQLLLESAVRYFGIEVDDALEMAEQTEV
jgi:hypothetical protein